MQADEHHDIVAEVDGLSARVLRNDVGVDAALELLDRAERTAGAPLVDESERARLENVAHGRPDRGGHWHAVLARRDGGTVGYAGLVLPASDDTAALARDDTVALARGDIAVDRDQGPPEPTLRVLLAAVEALGSRHDARRLQVWLRHATADDLDTVTRAGFALDRRLGVLTRSLADLPPAPAPADVEISSFTDADTDAVVDVLAAAYAGTPDGGWTRHRFDDTRAYGWFDPDDLLVARRPDGRLAGLHWTKRRGDGVGEVYNLAVHPDAQGERLGAALLLAGLEHLRAVACDEVILWVDMANEHATHLYTSLGFEVAWQDVALGRELAPDQPSSTSRLRSAGGTSL